jgi:hypothetical protein
MQTRRFSIVEKRFCLMTGKPEIRISKEIGGHHTGFLIFNRFIVDFVQCFTKPSKDSALQKDYNYLK